MKKTVFALGLALLVCLSCSAPALAAPTEEEPVTINVYNWGVYMADGTDGSLDINRAFTEATGIKVNYTTFDSNESMYSKLKTGGAAYDVIIPSDYMIARLIEEDMLAPLDYNNIPNYKQVDSSFKNQPFDPENRYTVPYTWGCVGLIYNDKYVKEENVDSWDLMWNPAYQGKILMFDNPRDSFAIAQLLLGQSLNSSDRGELEQAAGKLREQAPLVQDYVMDQIFSTMEREEAWVAAYYAGDYLLMAENNENLKFCFPKEGFNIFIDAMCIPKNAPHKEAAEAYINFLTSPEISAKNMEYLGYSTPISAAKNFLPAEIMESEIAYPSEEVLARGESFLNLPPEATQAMDELWLQVRTGAKGGINPMLIMGGVVLLILAVMLVMLNVKRKKSMDARRNVGR